MWSTVNTRAMLIAGWRSGGGSYSSVIVVVIVILQIGLKNQKGKEKDFFNTEIISCSISVWGKAMTLNQPWFSPIIS